MVIFDYKQKKCRKLFKSYTKVALFFGVTHALGPTLPTLCLTMGPNYLVDKIYKLREIPQIYMYFLYFKFMSVNIDNTGLSPANGW